MSEEKTDVVDAGTVKTPSGEIHTSKMYTDSGEIISHEESSDTIVLSTPAPGARMAEVGYNGSITVNMGNFESVKIGVSVTLPSYVEEVADAFRAAKDFVDSRLNSLVTEVKEHRDSRST